MADCFDDLKNLSPEQLSYVATTIAVIMSKDLNDDEVNALGSFFIGIGGTLSLIAKQRTLLKNCRND